MPLTLFKIRGPTLLAEGILIDIDLCHFKNFDCIEINELNISTKVLVNDVYKRLIFKKRMPNDRSPRFLNVINHTKLIAKFANLLQVSTVKKDKTF
jgi:hypothetical protein